MKYVSIRTYRDEEEEIRIGRIEKCGIGELVARPPVGTKLSVINTLVS